MANTSYLLILLCIFFTNSALVAQESMKPKVLIITTGGAIASQTNAPLIAGSELIQAVPALSEIADIEVEEFVNIGSSKMTPSI